MTHHGSIEKQKQKQNIGSLSLFRRGLGVVKRTYFPAKLSLYQTFHLFALTPVFSTCFEEIALSRTGWRPLPSDSYNPCIISTMWRRQATNINAVWNVGLFHPRISTVFRLWWCLVDGVQGGTISVLHSRSSTNQRSGLSLRRYGKNIRVSGDMGLGVDWERPTVITHHFKDYTTTLPI